MNLSRWSDMNEFIATPDIVAPAKHADGAIDAPRNLLGRPASRHRGTEIDGATLAPEGLWVRDKNLNDLIGTTTFEGAIAHLWFDREVDGVQQAAIGARLAAIGVCLAQGSAAQDLAAQLGAAGVEPVFAAAAGLLRGLDDTLADTSGASLDDADLDTLLVCASAAPFLLHAAINGRPFAASRGAQRIEAGMTHAQRMLIEWRDAPRFTGCARDGCLAGRVACGIWLHHADGACAARRNRHRRDADPGDCGGLDGERSGTRWCRP